MKAFFVRLSSGIVLLAVIIAAGLLGGDVLFALTLAISIIGYLEFLKVFHLENRAPGVWGFVFLAFYYVALRLWDVEEFALFFLIAYLLALLAVYVFTFPKYRTEEIAEAFLGFVYVPVHAVFYLADPDASHRWGEHQPGLLPDLYLLLGLRYLRLRSGNAFGET